MDELIGGTATSVHINSSVLMSVLDTGDIVIRQSRLYCQYQPAKSLVIRMTGVINADNNDIDTISRLGYFDKHNGLFFEYSNQIMKIVKRNNDVDEIVTQTDWNFDTLDGNGPSGITIPFDKNLIYNIEFAFLGVGVVKMGVYYGGAFYLAHCFFHTDILYPYIHTPNLPTRYEISSSGGAGELICTCASVQSEGGYNLIGNPFSIGMDTGLIIQNTNLTYGMSIRLKNNKRDIIRLTSISLVCSTSGNFMFDILKILSPAVNPIFIPATPDTPEIKAEYTSADPNAHVEYHFNTVTPTFSIDTTNAILLYRGYFSANVSVDYTNFSEVGGPIYLTAGIGDNSFYSDYIIIRVKKLSSGTETLFMSMNWIEV
jgi:hypothetical protein